MDKNSQTRHYVSCKASGVLDWFKRRAQAESLWPLKIGDSCCTNEFIAAQEPQYSSRQACWSANNMPAELCDLLIVSGPINKTTLPELLSEFNKMKSPKWVIALGACAINGGPFSGSYNTVNNLEEYLPIDVYVPGCPPGPEVIVKAVLSLKDHIREGEFRYE